LLLKVYTKDKIDAKRLPHDSHQHVIDRNIQRNQIFYITNMRRELSFSYYSWYMMTKLQDNQLRIDDLDKKFVEELIVTQTPMHQTLLHFLTSLESLNEFFKMLNDEASGGTLTKGEIPFNPNEIVFQPRR